MTTRQRRWTGDGGHRIRGGGGGLLLELADELDDTETGCASPLIPGRCVGNAHGGAFGDGDGDGDGDTTFDAVERMLGDAAYGDVLDAADLAELTIVGELEAARRERLGDLPALGRNPVPVEDLVRPNRCADLVALYRSR